MFTGIKSLLIKKYSILIFFLILILASFLRLNKISDYMTFLGDEGRDVLVVREILRGDLTLLGPRASAADFYLGPIYYYFMAPFLFFSNYHPVGPAIMVALFGIATVFFIFKIGKEFFGDFAGRFLNGEFGHFSRINPYLASFPYAADRWQVKDKIWQAINEGKLVICNRYTPSSIYQAAKIKPPQRKKFI